MRPAPVMSAALCALVLAGCSSSGPTGASSTAITSGPAAAARSAGPASSAAAAPPAAVPPPAASTAAAPPAPAQQAVPAESNPPGDIPDNLAFVPYANAAGRYRFTHPEGWAQTVRGAHALFTDKLNGVTAGPGGATSPPTAAGTTTRTVTVLRRTQPAFELRSVAPASEPGGRGVLVVYRRNSAPDEVTGRRYRDEVQRYELVRQGREVVLEMYGPVGADNVDAYRTMVQSLRIG